MHKNKAIFLSKYLMKYYNGKFDYVQQALLYRQNNMESTIRNRVGKICGTVINWLGTFVFQVTKPELITLMIKL